MTESTHSEDRDRDDRAVLTAMARVMASASGVPVPPSPSGADDSLIREYLETLGLLPYGLEPEAPSPAVKERILARIDDRPAAEPLPFPGARRPAIAAPERRRWWTGALAAALVLCLAGLAYLTGRVNQQNRTIARLGDELRGIPIADWTSLHAELEAMERRFNMVTAVARKAYHLQGVERVGNKPVDGVVYVCGNHQRWYLNVQGLEAPPAGQEYRLWFVTADGMVSGGEVRVGDDATAELEAPTMPEGTYGFAITLEEAGNDRSPGGIMVLLGEESISL